jgi:hypothetical protein
MFLAGVFSLQLDIPDWSTVVGSARDIRGGQDWHEEKVAWQKR